MNMNEVNQASLSHNLKRPKLSFESIFKEGNELITYS